MGPCQTLTLVNFDISEMLTFKVLTVKTSYQKNAKPIFIFMFRISLNMEHWSVKHVLVSVFIPFLFGNLQYIVDLVCLLASLLDSMNCYKGQLLDLAFCKMITLYSSVWCICINTKTNRDIQHCFNKHSINCFSSSPLYLSSHFLFSLFQSCSELKLFF